MSFFGAGCASPPAYTLPSPTSNAPISAERAPTTPLDLLRSARGESWRFCSRSARMRPTVPGKAKLLNEQPVFCNGRYISKGYRVHSEGRTAPKALQIRVPDPVIGQPRGQSRQIDPQFDSTLSHEYQTTGEGENLSPWRRYCTVFSHNFHDAQRACFLGMEGCR